MLEVLISWILISISSYIVGSGCYNLLSAGLDLSDEIPIPHPYVIKCLLGLCAVNVYAEIFSLFGGVGLVADAGLLILCILIVVFSKDHVFSVRRDMAGLLKSPVRSTIQFVLIIVMSYGTSRGYMHFDTNLYHAQAIRWIEEYGVVPGLANIQSRFGYNSAEFALNALYGFKWFIGRSLHTSAGFFALLSSFIVTGISGIFHRDSDNRLKITPRISDYVRIGLIFYLGIIYTGVISPTSDFYAQLLLFDIVILWLDSTDETQEDIPLMTESDLTGIQGILCILLVYAITVKLSLAPLVTIALVPGIYWITGRSYRKIVTCILSGILISIPFFIRGYLISGWILYPSTIVRLGSPDWQIPKGNAQYDAKEIGMWGRGITRAEEWDGVTAFNWVADWFVSLHSIEKLLILGSLCAIAATVVGLICHYMVLRKKISVSDIYPLMTVMSAGAIFWFVSAPLVRYGYVYLIILPFALIGMISGMTKGRLRQVANAGFAILAVGVTLLKLYNLCGDMYRMREGEFYICQQDYIDGEADYYIVDGVKVYVAVDAGQIGYYKIPSTVEERHDFGLRGDTLSEGFYHINQDQNVVK